MFRLSSNTPNAAAVPQEEVVADQKPSLETQKPIPRPGIRSSEELATHENSRGHDRNGDDADSAPKCQPCANSEEGKRMRQGVPPNYPRRQNAKNDADRPAHFGSFRNQITESTIEACSNCSPLCRPKASGCLPGRSPPQIMGWATTEWPQLIKLRANRSKPRIGVGVCSPPL